MKLINSNKVKTVIAFGLTTIVAWLIDKILDKTGLFDTLSNLIISINYSPLKVLNNTYPLWLIISLSIIFIIFFNLFKKLLRSRKISRRENQLISISKKYETYKLERDGIIIKSKIYFDEDENPFIESWSPFCSRHQIPIQMTHSNDYFNCNLPGCHNSITHYRFSNNNALDMAKNVMLSEIIAEVENLNLP